MSEKIVIKLHENEALVFFDWIKRFNENEDNRFEDQSEQRILWDIEALLEQNMVSILDEDYKNKLEKARKCIRDH